MKRRRKLVLITGCLAACLIAGYFIANAVIRKKVEDALASLPPALRVKYQSLKANVLTGSLEIQGIEARYQPAAGHEHSLTAQRISISGISFLQWITARQIRVGDIRADGVSVSLDDYLLEKDSALKSQPGTDVRQKSQPRTDSSPKSPLSLPADALVDRIEVNGLVVTGMDKKVRLHHLGLDRKERTLRLDTLEISPDRDKEEIGRSKGHQVDVLQAVVEGIKADDLDVMGLMRNKVDAGEISYHSSRIHIFRDRRLPLQPGDKPMPVAALEALPVDLRVGKVNLGTTRFEYEEYPKEGPKTGVLTIERLHGTMEPLLNRPGSGDPAFITVKTEGSLMGSGLVTATTLMPLQRHRDYKVDGVFHDLDVTRLNNPAENLGQLHLESGMLNSLDFHFEMGEERSTGKIVGEYHNLVADKLKEKGGELKVAKLKSFALKKFIIPKDKDKSLPVAKRTGKVDYKRDPQRYFSYYLLHSLLVGVKSSFSLGFLLPG